MFKDRYLEQIVAFNTKEDHRTQNKKVSRLLSALAVELKDLPHEKQKRIDFVINDLRDGYKFNWIGSVEHARCFVKG